MLKKFFTREVQIGIVVVSAIVLTIIGFNYLKGINIFTPSNHYFVTFENIGGLVESNSVNIKGFKVGQVRKINYDFTNDNSFVVELSVSDDIKLPKGTIARLYDDGLMGGKAIEFVYGEDSNGFYTTGDTIPSVIDGGLMSQLGEMVPQIKGLVSNIDSLVLSLNTTVNSTEIKNSLKSIESTTAKLQSTSTRLDGMMKKEIPAVLGKVDKIATNLEKVSNDLSQVDIANLMAKANSMLQNLDEVSRKINSNEGTLGLLINDKQLYNNLNSTMSNASSLVYDLKENPKRYVHFSLFGSKDKSQKK